ncbi:DNA-directed RNA polymerase subunit H [Candidatus Woesearchaeota archaeon]|nr:DNA-directed RNA polymerase subunit H [Candidatus Woesearchaeota archaeon]
MTKSGFDIKKHFLVPKHTKVSEKEKSEVLEKYHISVYDLPLIVKNDPAIKELDVKPGDVVKILRKSPTAGEAVFYRCVINV